MGLWISLERLWRKLFPPKFADRAEYERWRNEHFRREEATSDEAAESVEISDCPPSEPTPPAENKICPYCAHEFEKMPARKRRCPECQNTIMRYRDSESGVVTLMMEVQYASFMEAEAEAKTERVKQANSDSRIRRWRRILVDRYGYAEERFDRAQAAAFLPADGVWASFNELVMDLSDHHEFSTLYHEIAVFLNEDGKNPTKVLREANRHRLLDYKQTGVVERVSICSGLGCEHCTATDGATYSIDEALRIAPLPNPDCTFDLNDSGEHFCRCMYVADF